MHVGKGWTNISVKDELIARVDAFVAGNNAGFTSRGDVLATAVRQFLDEQTGTDAFRAFLERTLKAVALTEPKDVPSLLAALLNELDMRERQPNTSKASGARSKTESTSRQ